MTTTIKLEMRLPTEETSCHSHNNQEKAEASDSLTLFFKAIFKGNNTTGRLLSR